MKWDVYRRPEGKWFAVHPTEGESLDYNSLEGLLKHLRSRSNLLPIKMGEYKAVEGEYQYVY